MSNNHNDIHNPTYVKVVIPINISAVVAIRMLVLLIIILIRTIPILHDASRS